MDFDLHEHLSGFIHLYSIKKTKVGKCKYISGSQKENLPLVSLSKSMTCRRSVPPQTPSILCFEHTFMYQNTGIRITIFSTRIERSRLYLVHVNMGGDESWWVKRTYLNNRSFCLGKICISSTRIYINAKILCDLNDLDSEISVQIKESKTACTQSDFVKIPSEVLNEFKRIWMYQQGHEDNAHDHILM